MTKLRQILLRWKISMRFFGQPPMTDAVNAKGAMIKLESTACPPAGKGQGDAAHGGLC